jgi:hypothetical protein
MSARLSWVGTIRHRVKKIRRKGGHPAKSDGVRAAIAKGAALLAAASLLGSARASAEELETARLTYRAPANSCPDEESFRHQVAGKLGYEAFTEDGKHRASVIVRLERGRIRGRAEVTRRGQSAPGVRELDGEQGQCEALVAALATAVAIALDPVRGMQPAAPPPAPPASAPQIVVVREEPAPPPEEKKEEAPAPRAHVFGVADGVVSLGLAPAPAAGGQVGVGLAWQTLSIEATGRIEATTGPEPVDSGDRIEATVYSALLSPCAALDAWALCITGRVGAFQARAPDVLNPNLGTSLFGAVGARAGYVLRLGQVVSLRALAFVELPLVRTSLLINQVTVWTAPPVLGGLAVGAVFSAP